MPRRNRNVATTVARRETPPTRGRKHSEHSRKPSVKRRRFRLYGGEL